MSRDKSSMDEWDRAVRAMPYRAEEISDVDGTYVGTVFLDALVDNTDNQVVYGRRGTGKTHLFRRVQSELLTRFDELRRVPVYIDGATLEGAIGPHDDPAGVALSLYVELMKRTVVELSELIRGRISPTWLDKIFYGPKRERLERAQYAADQLTALLSQGVVRTLPVGEVSSEIEDLDEAVAKLRAAAGINASVGLTDPRRLGLKLDASAEKEIKKTSTNVTTRKIGGATYLPFADVAELIRELLAALDDAHLVILLDEWSAVGNSEVQPLLAQLLRLTFRRGSCLKVAAIPGRTWLFRHVGEAGHAQRIGFELGDDITADVDLDTVVFVHQDIEQLSLFFAALLRQHLGVRTAMFGTMSEPDFAQFLLKTAMGGPHVLTELIHASAAIPRDFINILRQATLLRRGARESKITTAHVRAAALKAFESKRTNLAASRKEALAALNVIYRDIVGDQKSYLFLLDAADAADPRIVELYTAKLIHRFPANWQDPEEHRTFVYYQVDYATLIGGLKDTFDKLFSGLPKILTSRPFGIRLFGSYSSLFSFDSALERYFVPTNSEERDPAKLIVDVSTLVASSPSTT